MKIIFLSFSDFKGGASQAAYSIFKSFKKKNMKFLTVYSKHKDTKEIFNLAKKIYILFLRTIEEVLIFFFSQKNIINH